MSELISPGFWWQTDVRCVVRRCVERLRNGGPAVDVGAARDAIANEQLRVVFEHASVGIALLGRDAGILHANHAFEQFLDRPLAELRGRELTDFSFGDDAPSTVALFRENHEKLDNHEATGTSGTVEARFVRADGSIVWGALSVARAGEVSASRFVAVLQDITERKLLESQLVHQAFHDALTRLPNRALFHDRVERALEHASREPRGLAVLFLDLDNFKDVNDTQGHAAGDHLLQVVAERLLSATRGSDTVARLGGDEFAVLLEHVDDLGGIEAVLDRIIGVLRRPVQLQEERTVTPGASLGVAVYSGTEGTDELLRNADLAMYEAKARSPGRWAVFEPSMHAAVLDRVTMETDLMQALERCQLLDRPRLEDTGRFPAFQKSFRPVLRQAATDQSEFHVAYQPIVDLVTGRVIAFEALARWRHPRRGDVSPEAFIPVAERSGIINTLGRWVLREACSQAVRWNCGRTEAPIAITVNLSGKQLAHEGIVSEVDAVLRETGLPPHLLVLEITETVIMQDAENTLVRLMDLKRLGVRLAIDDFGTGYSSLAYLQRFPVDVLKIDRVFADGLRDGRNDGAALVRTILALAQMLSLTTVFEGVEDAGQCESLRALGCASGQGFFFGRPGSVGEVDRLLSGECNYATGESAAVQLSRTGDVEPLPRRNGCDAVTEPG
ncbi:MAG: EAL domain-containing protein [Gemmatimonadota bacterium]